MLTNINGYQCNSFFITFNEYALLNKLFFDHSQTL